MDDGAERPPILHDLALEALEPLGEVSADAQAGVVTTTVYSRAGRPFALLASAALEVRLEPLVVAAALRTPDTATSDRGPEWVRFAPRSLDRFAADRVVAWIAHAWRHAAD